MCLYELALSPSVQLARGFDLVNEGTAQKTKWGYVATAVGSELVLQLDTRAPQAHPPPPAAAAAAADGGRSSDGANISSSRRRSRSSSSSGSGSASGGVQPVAGAGSNGASPAAPAVSETRRVAIYIAHLKSYNHMGTATAR
jgi:hypothetical protein